MAVIASAFAFTACEEDIDLGFAKLSLDPLELSFGPEESSATISIIATRDWKVTTELPDWISLSATSGEADIKPQTITVTVLENKGNDREATIHLLANTEKGDLVVKQKGALGEIKKGSGTKDDPYTVAGVLEFIETLGADKESDKVYVKGIITSVGTTFEASGTYGNATFYIADAADAEQTFYVYQTYYLGNRKWKSGDTEVKAGDEVIIYGPVVNYKGNTPETAGKGASFIYSLNGKSEGGDTGGNGQGTTGEAKGTGTEADPFNVAAAIAKAKEVGQTESAQAYYIKGKVSAVAEAFGAQYGNGTFDLVDEGFEAVFTAFRILYFGNKKWVTGDKSVNAGDEIVVVGKIVNYKGNTPETSQGSGYLYSLNGEKGDGTTTPPEDETKATPAGDGSQANPFNVSAAIDKALAVGETATDTDFYVKGKVASITEQFGAQYGNGTFVLVDEGYTAKFTAYRILYFGNQKWAEGDATVAVGDEIVAVGKIVNFKGNTPEITQGGYLYSLNGQTSIEQSDVFGVEKTEIRVAASATSAEIKVIGNVAWTVSRKPDPVTCNPVSGQGAGTITVTFPANESTENEVGYTVALSTEAEVADKTILVNIVQAKAGETVTPDFASNVTWSSGSNQSYSEKANVNGVADVAVLKLGTSSKTGSSTLTLPAGSTSLTFYALSWKAKPSKIIFKNGDTEIAGIDPAANDGLANTAPYTLTVTESDCYTITFDATATLTVETSGSNTRAILFGVVAK